MLCFNKNIPLPISAAFDPNHTINYRTLIYIVCQLCLMSVVLRSRGFGLLIWPFSMYQCFGCILPSCYSALQCFFQDSVLGPILQIAYTILVYEISLSRNIPSRFFADDSQLYKRFKPTADAAQKSVLSSRRPAFQMQKSWMKPNKQQLNDAFLYAFSRVFYAGDPLLMRFYKTTYFSDISHDMRETL